ncbi:MAG: DUF418 domain-containing protein [Chloroflexi bacterium]|nr:DUF418 domain-containing protein [Chloroflexota bacterium]
MKQRIVAIDVLRGFALLGILLMNMSSFAMPLAYSNPTVYGGNDIWNRLVFDLSYIFANQKMMALFSMLFGASVMLVTQNIERKGKSPFRYHYIRNIWLLAFGFLHAVLLWSGDILMVYAACSFVLYWFRKLSPKWQFGLGLTIFLLPVLSNFFVGNSIQSLTPIDRQYLQSDTAVSKTDIAEELAYFRGSYAPQFAYRLGIGSADDYSYESNEPYNEPYTDVQSLLELDAVIDYSGRAFGMMLIGMAFYSWGILLGKRSEAFYKKMAAFGFGLGIPVAMFGLFQLIARDWDALYASSYGLIPNHIATPLIASGYIALIMLWSRSSTFNKLRTRFAAAGRMALTNYISQSFISTFIFYGFGFGLFGYLDRVQQFMVILFIWAVQLMFSSWWLSYFQYGPLEWGWRTLSRWEWQPLWKKKITQVSGASFNSTTGQKVT